jgi:hypothetical protein
VPVLPAGTDLDLSRALDEAVRLMGVPQHALLGHVVRLPPATQVPVRFQFRTHPPSSWGLIEHGILTSTILYGDPAVLAGILRTARDKLGTHDDVIELVQSAAYNFDNDGRLVFYLEEGVTAFQRMVLDAAIRDAAMRRHKMHSQLGLASDPFAALLRQNSLLLMLLREFPVAPCP